MLYCYPILYIVIEIRLILGLILGKALGFALEEALFVSVGYWWFLLNVQLGAGRILGGDLPTSA
jgi:hypothetical protein